MKVIKSLTIFILFLLFTIFSPIYAQEEFEKVLKKFDKKFEKFVEEHDKKFIEFLSKEWEEFDFLPGFVRDKKPKPVDIPIFKTPEIPEEEEIEEKIIPPPLLPVIPEEEVEEKKPVKVPEIVINFFGVPLGIEKRKSKNVAFEGQINNEKISNFWKEMCLTDYDDIIKKAGSIREQMKLNDWGHYLLLKNIVDKMYAGSQNEKTIVLWFLLLKSGFNAKVGYQDNEIFLLLPFSSSVFEIPYFKIKDDIFYNVSVLEGSKNLNRIYTYEEDYPGSINPIDLNLRECPYFDKENAKRNLSFLYNKKKHSVLIDVNNYLIDFYSYYPNTDIPLYFNAAVSQESVNSLERNLRPLVMNKSDIEAVNILLRFVQTAFDYKVDQEQFGKEKFMFIEETLHYPYSDCEDRAVLFAHLVRDILELDVVGLRYDGHIATAVKFNDEIDGDTVVYSGEKYIICDPTYMYADAGNCMPEFKEEKPKIIPIK